MKTPRLYARGKNILTGFVITFTGIIIILMLFSLSSCSKKVSFAISASVPAARGYITIKKDNNKNYVIKVLLSDLAEVTRLQPPKQTYVVWMETDRNIIKKIGLINSSSGTLSGKLKASFETVSAFRPTKIFITAEVDESAETPDMQIVITTENF